MDGPADPDNENTSVYFDILSRLALTAVDDGSVRRPHNHGQLPGVENLNLALMSPDCRLDVDDLFHGVPYSDYGDLVGSAGFPMTVVEILPRIFLLWAFNSPGAGF